MTRLYVVEIWKGHIQCLAQTAQPAKCIDKEGNVARELAIGKVCPHHHQMARKSRYDDQSSSHRLSAFCFHKNSTTRLRERNLLQEISMES